MWALAAAAIVLGRGHFLASPYLEASHDLAMGFDAAAALDAAEAGMIVPDDTPSTAGRIPSLREALAAAAAARFADAARELATFAAAEPRAREAGWALRRSYQYWRALGRDDEARAVLAAYESTQARREPRAAALFFWQRRAELTDDAQRTEHARRYLAEHAAHGPRDLRIVAESELAALLWRRSCDSERYGLCIDVTPVRNEAACSPLHLEQITARARDPKLRRAALAHAAAALRAGARLDVEDVDPWRRPALRVALGQAATITADETLERLIALEHPAGLDFYVEEWKRDSGVARWEAEYRDQARRHDRSERLFLRYWQQYQPRVNLALERVSAVADHRSGPAIMATSVHLAVALAKVQNDRWLKFDVPEKFKSDTAFVCCIDPQPLAEEVRALLAGCARMARAGGYSSPDVAVCFDGFDHYGYPDLDDPLVEFHGPPG